MADIYLNYDNVSVESQEYTTPEVNSDNFDKLEVNVFNNRISDLSLHSNFIKNIESIAASDAALFDFGKVLNDNVYFEETLHKIFDKYLDEGLTVSEIVLFILTRHIQDSFYTADNFNIKFTKVPIDEVFNTEIVAKTFDKDIGELVYSTDVVAKNIDKPNTDIISGISDYSERRFIKASQDSTSVIEILNKSFNKLLIDVVNVYDEFTPRVSFLNNDGLTLSDSISIDMYVGKSDSINITENLLVHKQDYFSEDYTQEEYVGQLYTY
jgi:hypothetical protein